MSWPQNEVIETGNWRQEALISSLLEMLCAGSGISRAFRGNFANGESK